MDRWIEGNQMSLMRDSVEVIPPFNALSLILTNCSELTSHTIKHPLTPTWLGRRDGLALAGSSHTAFHLVWAAVKSAQQHPSWDWWSERGPDLALATPQSAQAGFKSRLFLNTKCMLSLFTFLWHLDVRPSHTWAIWWQAYNCTNLLLLCLSYVYILSWH